MKLSISNIAWNIHQDEDMYQYLKSVGFEGIEIAPTRLVTEDPYNHIDKSIKIAKRLEEKYNLKISSMQSIWFGRTESIFGTKDDRDNLIAYTEKAIEYAESINCKNLVFGSPKNRNIDDISKHIIAVDFFRTLGEHAEKHGVVIALEPNPVIYNTNFINRTDEAIRFVKEVNTNGLKVNLDLGTVIWNNEDLKLIFKDVDIINHIHISEPYLEQIKRREIHNQLKVLLQEKEYKKYVSIEMKNLEDIDVVKSTINYVNEVMQ